MSRMFREGGPLNIKQLGGERYSFDIPLRQDADGRLARQCPSEECAPGLFKVRPGTGVQQQAEAFCPYCRHSDEPGSFATQEQVRYARETVVRQAHAGAQEMLKSALGLNSTGRRQLTTGMIKIGVELKSSPLPSIRQTYHDEVRRDVICPHCSLDHSVYGLATWCADCGADIFLTHVDAELGVVRLMLSDVARRREQFGSRIAAKDLENTLEDVVSIHEAVLRILVRRHMTAVDKSAEQIETCFKRLGNGFQNPQRALDFFRTELQKSLGSSLALGEFETLTRTFQKRHPIAHNLGVVDRKYLEQSKEAATEGREVSLSAAEIETVIEIAGRLFGEVHQALIAPQLRQP